MTIASYAKGRYSGPDYQASGKLVNTVEVVDFRNTDNVYRETVLTRIGVDSATRHEVIEFCQILGAHIVDVTRDALTIEVTGGEYKIDRFLSLIEDYDVQMLTRSGRIALPKPHKKNLPVFFFNPCRTFLQGFFSSSP